MWSLSQPGLLFWVEQQQEYEPRFGPALVPIRSLASLLALLLSIGPHRQPSEAEGRMLLFSNKDELKPVRELLKIHELRLWVGQCELTGWPAAFPETI